MIVPIPTSIAQNGRTNDTNGSDSPRESPKTMNADKIRVLAHELQDCVREISEADRPSPFLSAARPDAGSDYRLNLQCCLES